MNYRALVVEDDHVIAEVLRMKLEREGHAVTVAPNQHDAYHLLDQESFEFVLLDLRLPTHDGDMNPDSEVGFDILCHIRDRFTPTQLPVIVMTAYEDTSQTAVRALRALANDYITKPFEDSSISLNEKIGQIILNLDDARRVDWVSGTSVPNKKHNLVFYKDARIEVDGIEIMGKSNELIWLLKTTLVGSIKGDQSPCIKGNAISKATGVQPAAVRRRVSRFRDWIATQYADRNLGPIDDQAIIRNDRHWDGYELNRETCGFSYE